MRFIYLLSPLLVFPVVSCSGHSAPSSQNTVGYKVLNTNLAELREDFNANAGKVRLLFIVGPTCPECLRGMDDLGKALANEQDNPKLRTFVVYVPELHAKSQDIGPTVSLLPGKFVSRYWDPNQSSERVFKKMLNTAGLAWDVWMIYGPEQRWNGAVPPMPEFWMDQLYGMPEKYYLNPAVFKKQVERRLALVSKGTT